jgi:hypothetical protein
VDLGACLHATKPAARLKGVLVALPLVVVLLELGSRPHFVFSVGRLAHLTVKSALETRFETAGAALRVTSGGHTLIRGELQTKVSCEIHVMT